MPKTNVVFFAAEDGSVPVLEWISGLPEKVQDKLVARIAALLLLRQGGRAVTRPHEGGHRSTEGNRVGNQTKGKIPSRSGKAHVPGDVR